MLIGKEALERLKRAKIAVFGIGGVGGYAVEALARCGIGALELVDSDRVSVTNLNRQIIALHSSIGRFKTEAAAERVADINPECRVSIKNVYFSEENARDFDFSGYDYVIDAIDSVSSKICLIETAINAGVPIISAMGAGNKLDPTRLEVSDIYKTSVCPLARVMRYELRKRGIKALKVVYSKEEPIKVQCGQDGKKVPGSISFVPSAAGLILAGEVIKDIAFERTNVS